MPARSATRYDGVYKSGKTSYKYVLDLDPVDGKRRQESRGGFRSAEDAHKERVKRLVELHRGVNTNPSRQTVAEYLADWLRVRAQSIRPSSVRVYRDCIETRINPTLGHYPLPKLAPSHLRAWHATLGKTHAPASIRQAHVVLSMALGDAVDDGALSRNVARLVTPPQPTDAERTVWSLEQVAAFLAVAERDEWAALWRLALLTGMRRGEMLALRWPDVDLKARVLTVRNTLTTDDRGHWLIGPAKNRASQAELELDDSTVAALQKQRRTVAEMRLAARYWDDEFVFPRADGQFLAPSSVGERLRDLCAEAGVPRIRIHDLRHIHASLLYAGGADAKLIQERLRHSRLSTTMDTYTHLRPGRQRAMIGELAAALDAVVDTSHQQSGHP